MKKLPLLFFCVILIFTSCTNEPAPLVRNFSAEITAASDKTKIKAKIVANEHNVVTVKIKSPKPLKGYTYSYKDRKLQITYSGLKIDAQDDYLPDTAFPQVIYNVLKSLSKENNCKFSGTYNSFAEYKGKCDSGKFSVFSEYSTGAIRKISIKSIDFNAEFKNIRLN